jgi:SAM-dependent methyltransferase
MKPGCRVLDLCCGDGFYPYHFYSGRASRILALDYDRAGIRFAERNFRAPNLAFLCADIRTQIPREPFDNVTWDAGIDFFSLADIKLILDTIKDRLAPSGLLSGVAPKLHKGQVAHNDQRHEFASGRELGDLLRGFFRNVAILELAGSQTSRAAFYFYASDGPLPFDPDAGYYLRLS